MMTVPSRRRRRRSFRAHSRWGRRRAVPADWATSASLRRRRRRNSTSCSRWRWTAWPRPAPTASSAPASVRCRPWAAPPPAPASPSPPAAPASPAPGQPRASSAPLFPPRKQMSSFFFNKNEKKISREINKRAPLLLKTTFRAGWTPLKTTTLNGTRKKKLESLWIVHRMDYLCQSNQWIIYSVVFTWFYPSFFLVFFSAAQKVVPFVVGLIHFKWRVPQCHVQEKSNSSHPVLVIQIPSWATSEISYFLTRERLGKWYNRGETLDGLSK